MSLEHSRSLRLGAAVTGKTESELEARLRAAHVTVSAEAPYRATAELLVETLRRGPGAVHVLRGGILNPEGLAAAASLVDPLAGVDVVDHPAGVHVHLGRRPSAADIRVVPEGHGARLAPPSVSLDAGRPASGLGAMLAAAFAEGEAFKRVAGVRPELGPPIENLTFCPVTLSSDLLAAPDLSATTPITLMLVGLGAIGTAVARILSMLPLHGTVILVDHQSYAVENRGTYSLGTDSDARAEISKVDLAATVLERWTVRRHPGRVEEVAALIDASQLPQPDVVLCGLDSIPARHAAQRLWPDRLIDAATGNTSLGTIDIRAAGRPCVMCLVPEPAVTGPSAAARLAEFTGLPAELLARGEEVLRPEHLDELTEEQRRLVAPHVGKRVCGLANATGLTTVEAGDYMPSVPFVSQQAACLGVGRLAAALTGAPTAGNLVQYDALLGPARMEPLTLGADPTCDCTRRRAVIEAVRAARGRP